MKKFPALMILILFAAVPLLSAQSLIDLAPFQTDFQALMTSIGREIVPNLQAIALSGDVLGEASLDHFTFTLLGVGVNLANGVGKILAPGAYDWQFVLPLSSLVQTALSGIGAVGANAVEAARSVVPFPALRFALGFPVWGGFELLGSGFWIPQAATDLLVSLLEPSGSGTVSGLHPRFSILNFGVKARKVFLTDRDWTPAVSAALGYVYSDVGLGVSLDSLSALAGQPIDVAGIGTLDMSGKLDFHTFVHSAGLDFHVSKRLAVFTPFLKLSTWYQYASFVSGADMTATVTPSQTGAAAISLPLETATDLVVSDISFLMTTGLELRLLYLVISPSVTIDFDDPIVSLRDPSLDLATFKLAGVQLNGIAFNLGIRLQF